MSDTSVEATETAAETAPSDSKPETKPTETVDFWKAKAREQEKRAKENAEAAKRLSEIEEANKSEAQKAADRIAALEQEATAAKASALRFKIAAKFQVSDEDADLFLTGTDEDTLTKQAERLAQRTEEAGKPRTPKPNPDQGKKPGASAGQTNADLFASVVSDQLSN